MRYAADGLLGEHIGSRKKASDHSLSFYSFGFEKAKDTAGCRVHYLIIIVGERKNLRSRSTVPAEKAVPTRISKPICSSIPEPLSYSWIR